LHEESAAHISGLGNLPFGRLAAIAHPRRAGGKVFSLSRPTMGLQVTCWRNVCQWRPLQTESGVAGSEKGQFMFPSNCVATVRNETDKI
jgi:hypothetical protein